MPVLIEHDHPLVFGQTSPNIGACGYELSCKTCEEKGVQPKFPKRGRVGVIFTRDVAQKAIAAAYQHDVYEHREEGKVKIIFHLKTKHEDNLVK